MGLAGWFCCVETVLLVVVVLVDDVVMVGVITGCMLILSMTWEKFRHRCRYRKYGSLPFMF